MGEHHCHFCGHLTTGFEAEEFHARQHELDTLKSTITTLEQQLAEARADREVGGKLFTDYEFLQSQLNASRETVKELAGHVKKLDDIIRNLLAATNGSLPVWAQRHRAEAWATIDRMTKHGGSK